jgi:SnoaL-like polyketide cyclase
VTRADNASCLATHLAAERRLDMDATLATLHPDCLFVDEPLGLRLEGRGGARRHYELWWSAFGATPEDGRVHWVDDDLLVGEATFVGTHRGRFAGLAPTDRPIQLPFVVFVDFRDGMLAGERFVYDLNTLLRQLDQPAFEPTVARR